MSCETRNSSESGLIIIDILNNLRIDDNPYTDDPHVQRSYEFICDTNDAVVEVFEELFCAAASIEMRKKIQAVVTAVGDAERAYICYNNACCVYLERLLQGVREANELQADNFREQQVEIIDLRRQLKDLKTQLRGSQSGPKVVKLGHVDQKW